MEYSFFEIVGVLFISFIGLMLPFFVIRIADKICYSHNEKVKKQNAFFDKLDSIESRLNKIDEVLKNGK